MGQRYNFTINQGESFSALLNVTDSNGNAINLSGYSVRSYIKEKLSSTTGIANFDTQVLSPAVNGLITLSLTASGTAGIPANIYNYDAEAYLTNDSDVIKLLYGYVEIVPESTK